MNRGDRVTPASSRSALGPGEYVVESCHEPQYPGDDVIVFVEGHRTGVSGEYLRLAED